MIAENTTTLHQPELSAMMDEFFREGCVVIPNLLTPDEVAALRAKTDEYALNPDPASKHTSYASNAFVLRYCHEIDPLFQAMMTHAPILKVVEAALGPNAKFNAMNVIRNAQGQAISRWHVDDVLEFPLPPEIPRFDARIRMPVFWMTVQVALSDIDQLEHGPTQFVPQSHYSGRKPTETLEFEGQGPRSVFCKAGDIYLTNHQCWHRGAPNLSDSFGTLCRFSMPRVGRTDGSGELHRFYHPDISRYTFQTALKTEKEKIFVTDVKHLTMAELETGLDEIRQSPKAEGPLQLIVRRPQTNEREVLAEGKLDLREGLVGDTWIMRGSSRTTDGSSHPDMQLNVMNARVIALVAQDKERWQLAGDQLFIDIDLSAENVPPGTQLAIGSAVIEVTDQPHTGCAKFVSRFGMDAMKFVNSPVGKELHLRGINAKVVQPGVIRVGDVARKLG